MSEKHPDRSKYLGPEESHRELLSHLDAEARLEWDSFGHARIEPAFQDRVFVIYECMGRKNNSPEQRPPKIITTVRVLNFIARDENGCVVRLLNEETNDVMEVTHVPKKVFDYPIFASIPANFTLRWDAHPHGGQIERSLSYLLHIKSRNKAEFFSRGNTYMETPNKLRDELYRHLKLDLKM